jgi:excisionase family DNA binding protein
VTPVREAKTYETVADAARRTGVSTKTIRRRIAEGQLTGYRFGPHLIRLNPTEVDNLLRPIPGAAA